MGYGSSSLGLEGRVVIVVDGLRVLTKESHGESNLDREEMRYDLYVSKRVSRRSDNSSFYPFN